MVQQRAKANLHPHHMAIKLQDIHDPKLRQRILDADTPRRSIPHTITERDQAPTLDAAAQGKGQGDGRPLVRFTGYRVRPLDPDNFAGSVKDLLDGLRLSGIIKGDEPWRIRLETEQHKVEHFREERTEITITFP
jgi:hypothetical protein